MSIILNNITKSFDDKTVLNNINVTFNDHSFHVILGENGSGKTTLFKIMIGLMSSDKGTVSYDSLLIDKNYKEIQNKIGVVLADDRTLYHKLTAYENLYYVGRIYNIPKLVLKEKIPYLLKQLHLDNDKKLVEDFSTGMKKKVMIARALLTDPDYIFGDEIFNGLDEETSRIVCNLLVDEYKKGKTIIIITHILDYYPEDAIVHHMKDGVLQ